MILFQMEKWCALVIVQKRMIADVKPIRCFRSSSPQDIVYGGRLSRITSILYILSSQSIFKVLIHDLLVNQSQKQVSTAQTQADDIYFPADLASRPFKQKPNDGDNERQRVKRINDKNVVEGHPVFKWPKQLSAPGGKTIEHRVGKETPEKQPGPIPPRSIFLPMNLRNKCPQDGRQDQAKQD